MSTERPPYRRVIPIKPAAADAGMSPSTFRRHHADKLVQISPGKVGVFDDVLQEIINACPPAGKVRKPGPGRGHKKQRDGAAEVTV